jgi:hypothetical protein
MSSALAVIAKCVKSQRINVLLNRTTAETLRKRAKQLIIKTANVSDQILLNAARHLII